MKRPLAAAPLPFAPDRPGAERRSSSTAPLAAPLVRAVRAALVEALGPGDAQPASRRVVVGCSGGPDSTALLVALWALRGPLGLELHVVCVDHQLRAGSADEARAVVAAAQRLGLGAEVARVTVPGGASRMAAARAARYQALRAIAQDRGAQALAVGHTRDDQAETMLMRWLGGAGLRGLGGMALTRRAEAADGPLLLVRPLLRTARAEIDRFLAGLSAGPDGSPVAPLPLSDPTNADARFLRARLRHTLLPQLRCEQPRLDAHLGELAEQLRADADYLDAQADAALERLRIAARSTLEAGGAVPGLVELLPAAEAAALPQALLARVLQRISPSPLGRRHLGAIRALAGGQAGSRRLSLPGGLVAERRYESLLFIQTGQQIERPDPRIGKNSDTDVIEVTDFGDYKVGPRILRLTPQPEPGIRPDGRSGVRLYLPAPGFPLHLRPPRPGDRLTLWNPREQRPYHKKLSDVLIDLKVPRAERGSLRLLCAPRRSASSPAPASSPVETDSDEILWVLGLRAAETPPVSDEAPVPGGIVVHARLLPTPLADLTWTGRAVR